MKFIKGTDRILESKKILYLDVVKRAAESRGVVPPRVNFEGEKCSGYNGNEMSHIHIDDYIICVPLNVLRSMSDTEIADTATQEVSHIFDLSHGPSFHEQNFVTKIPSLELPPGVILVYEGVPKPKIKLGKKKRPDKTCCNQPTCQKKLEITQCHHCESYYCKEHIKGYEPGAANYQSSTMRERFRAMERQDGGHACPGYITFKEGEKERQLDAMKRFLDNDQVVIPKKEGMREAKTEAGDRPVGTIKKENKSIGWIVTIAMILIVLSSLWIVTHPGIIGHPGPIKTDVPSEPTLTLPPTTSTTILPLKPNIRPAFDEFILERYSGLKEYDGLLRIKDDTVIKVPEDLAKHYFSSDDKTIKGKALEWTHSTKTFKGDVTNIINWARTKTTYDFEKAESDNPKWQTASETLKMGTGICGDQARLMAGLLYNAGYKNITLVSADCKGDTINGKHGFVVLYHDGKEYYIDLTNRHYNTFDPATTRYYKYVCKNVYEVATPTMLISNYLD